MKKLIIFMPSIEDGGVEKNLFLISNYLSKKINKIEIITANYDYKNRFNKNINFIGLDLKYLRNKGRIFKYIFCLFVLVYQIFKNNRKLTILSFQANIYVIIIARFFAIKVISRSNSSPSGWSTNFFKTLIFKIFLKRADLTIVNSIEFKNEMLTRFDVRAKTIYNPLDIDFITKKLIKTNKKLFRSKPKFLKILSIGRLTEQKDFFTLLKAINLIKNKIDLKLIIIGKGAEKKKLINYVKENNLNQIISFAGYKKNPYNYIKQADIFILTSKFEGLPNVLLEAQLFKKFIISSNCPTGPKEILLNGKAGNLFNIGDYKQLSKCILQYNKNKNKNKIQLGFNSLHRFNFDINMKEYYKTIYKFL